MKEEISDVKNICRSLPLLLLVLSLVPLASAQSTFDVNVGFGGVHDKASSTGIDQLTFLSCSPATDATCSTTPALSGFMLGFGANLMLWKHFGVGGEVNLQPGKQNFAVLQPAISSIGQPQINLQSRVTFYDFNGIYEPLSTKKAALQLIGGIGGTNVKFYENVTGANGLVGSFNQSQYAASSNHFNVHGGVGVQIYLSDHFFIRPQFDIYYVPNFIQFGSNAVIGGSAWVGYTFGDRQ